MSNKVSFLFITVLISRKDSNILFKVILKTAQRIISITYGQGKITISISFKGLSLDIFADALGKNKTTLQNHLGQNKMVFGDEWDFFTPKMACPYAKRQKWTITQNYHRT